MYGEEERVINGLGGETRGMRRFGRRRLRLEDNIKLDLQEVEWG
jgi:hypothetical protein